MLKTLMLVTLGFVIAALFALMLAPILWRRAVRLTTRRVQGSAPISMADIQADKDQLRAEFAMSTRRLEISLEELKNKASGQLIELSKRNERIDTQDAVIREKAHKIEDLQAEIENLKENLLETESQSKNNLESYKQASVEIRQLRREMADISGKLHDSNILADERKVENAALQTTIARHLDTIEAQKQEMSADRQNFENEMSSAAETSSKNIRLAEENATNLQTELTKSQIRIKNDEASLLEMEKVKASLEGEIIGLKDNLETVIATKDRIDAKLSSEQDKLRDTIDENNELKNKLRDLEDLAAQQANEIEQFEERLDRTVSDHKKEVQKLEDGWQQAEAERKLVKKEASDLKSQVRSLSKSVESGWEEERIENALLRERVNDVAAEVSKMALALEGEDGTISQILNGHHRDNGRGNSHHTSSESVLVDHVGSSGNSDQIANERSKSRSSTLAERIKALQNHSAS